LATVPEAFLVLWAAEHGVGTAAIPLLWMLAHAGKSILAYAAGDLSDRLGRVAVVVAGSPRAPAAVTPDGEPAGAEESLSMSSFLFRKSDSPERGESQVADPERFTPDLLPQPQAASEASIWSASPSLERIQRQFDEQIRAIGEAKRLLEERLAPFQQHLLELRRNVDRALKQLEAHLKPLRQYLEGQRDQLERIGTKQNVEQKDEFDPVDRFLAEQRQILEQANRHLEEQQRPLIQYLEDQQRAIEDIFWDLEETLEPFGAHLKEQQRLLEAIAEARVTEEFQALASCCAERQAALERAATAAEYHPQPLFADLDGIYEKYRTLDDGKSRLLTRLLEQTRQADLRLRESLRPSP
ncbi:MAG: hypothetical protein L0191_01790, partial [Acidobacteria bacterium]|nr:hypothetical protein [Acidobacteriota bacterium]